jgi:anti-sigma regulatory factor (Ser/Thr protein kinase)
MNKIHGLDNVIMVEKNHLYVMFLPADMIAVKRFRRELQKSLRIHNFPEEDIQQIELACDEALTNSITANIKNYSQETIICKWRIEGFTFTLLLLDYGKGIPSEKNSCCEKPKSLAELLENFTKLELDCQNILPFSGVPKIHKNMGQGLNIIRKIMDKVSIHYHKNDAIIDSLVESVDGSLLELEFSCKKR